MSSCTDRLYIICRTQFLNYALLCVVVVFLWSFTQSGFVFLPFLETWIWKLTVNFHHEFCATSMLLSALLVSSMLSTDHHALPTVFMCSSAELQRKWCNVLGRKNRAALLNRLWTWLQRWMLSVMVKYSLFIYSIKAEASCQPQRFFPTEAAGAILGNVVGLKAIFQVWKNWRQKCSKQAAIRK